jgi:hypothetical protein
MSFTILKEEDTSSLDAMLLDEQGFCKVLPAETIKGIPRQTFQLWCMRNAVYLYPTQELVEFLKNFIGTRTAIEVGAGNGHLGNALGITMTDSGMQTRPDIIAQYETIGQVCTNPPANVEILDAEAAVLKYKPQVVVASWLTHKWTPGLSTGNQFGPDENVIIENTEHYVHIGNDKVHKDKPCWQSEHTKDYHPWIVSRASEPEKDHVAIFKGKK